MEKFRKIVKKGLTFCSNKIMLFIVATESEVKRVSQKLGRPKLDHSKDVMLRVRIDKELENKLEIASKNLNITKSDVVRNGIEREYQRSLKKE